MFEHLTRRVLARLPSRRLGAAVTSVSARGLSVRQTGADRLVTWNGVDRVVATVAGDRQALVLGLSAGGALTVTEADPVWAALVEQLPLGLPGAERAATWRLALAGGADPVSVFER